MLVEMYDEQILISLETGEGFDRVLKKIDPLLNKKAKEIAIK